MNSFKVVSLMRETFPPSGRPFLKEARPVLIDTDVAHFLVECLLQVLIPPEFPALQALFDTRVQPEVIWHKIWAVRWVWQDSPSKVSEMLKGECCCVGGGIIHVQEPPPTDCTPGSPVLASNVKAGEYLAEHNLVDGDRSVDKLPVNQAFRIKECDDHHFAGSQCSLSFLGVRLHASQPLP